MKKLLLLVLLLPCLALAQRATLQDSSSIIKPGFVAADLGQFGLPVYGGFSQAGAGVTGYARTDTEAPFFINFVNLGNQNGGSLLNGSGSTNLQIWSLQHQAPWSQGMLSFMTATGDTWQSVGADMAGTQLGEIAFFPFSTHGMVQTETASIWAYLDQNCTDLGPAPIESNTSCGTNIVFRTAPNGSGHENTAMTVGQDGAVWLGQWPSQGLPTPFPGGSSGSGALVLANSSSTIQPVTGAVVLKAEGGQLYVRLPGSGGEQPVVIQNGGITAGHHVCWQAWGVVGDCGN